MSQAASALFDRGLHYVHVSLDALLFQRERIDSPIEFAVIYAALGIELILKHRLFMEHWTLVFSDPSKATLGDFESGSFHSVSIEVSIKRLKEVCGISIADQEKAHLVELGNSRNRLIHFGDIESEEAAMSCVGLAIHTALGFIDKAYSTENLTPKQTEALKEVRITGSKCIAYIEKVWHKIRKDVNAIWMTKGIFRCPRCFQIAAFFKGKLVCCLFCKYESENVRELLFENVKNPRRYNATIFADSGCCDKNVFVFEWKNVDGELLEREKTCFTCCKRLDF